MSDAGDGFHRATPMDGRFGTPSKMEPRRLMDLQFKLVHAVFCIFTGEGTAGETGNLEIVSSGRRVRMFDPSFNAPSKSCKSSPKDSYRWCLHE